MDTTNISLRSLSHEDELLILDILTSQDVRKTYMLPDYHSREDAIPLFLRLMELSKDSNRYVRCISLGQTAVGFLNDVEIKNNTIELGYVIHPDYHNRGIMTAALKLAISELFQSGYTDIHCGAFEENRASQRVMAKCGMKLIPLTEEIEYRGNTHICVYYHIANRKENGYENSAHL